MHGHRPQCGDCGGGVPGWVEVEQGLGVVNGNGKNTINNLNLNLNLYLYLKKKTMACFQLLFLFFGLFFVLPGSLLLGWFTSV